MFGFFFGFACLIALFFVLRRSRWGWGGPWRYGYGRSYGYRRFGWRGSWQWGPRSWLRSLFQQLDTTPGQEKVILASIEEVLEPIREMREALNELRRELGEQLRQESFDPVKAADILSRQRTLVEKVQATLVESLGKVHQALNPQQRRQLSDWIQFGPSCRRGWGPGPMSPAGIQV